MKILQHTDISGEEVDRDDASGVKIRWVISDKEGVPTFSKRVFEVASGGFAPLHVHTWEHEVFILSGSGLGVHDGDEKPVAAGDTDFVAPDDKHQFRNTGTGPLQFIRLIPHSD